MESENKLKENDIKNGTCYYWDDIMRAIGIYSGDILLDEKSHEKYENILIFDISYKTFMAVISLRIRFAKTGEFIKIYEEIGYLAILGHSWFDKFF